jgi:cyclic pyranopterin phosphate synthase
MPTPPHAPLPPLLDRFGRRHRSLRVSVTDRCNIRCFYCMPAEQAVFRPRAALLSYEEIARFVAAVIPLGVDKVRITGGEPLVRSELPVLVERLAGLEGLADLALTTNGILLPELAAPLRRAGLRRINVSLDSLRETTFRTIARRGGVHRVLAGIAAAQDCGFADVRLNAVAIRGVNEDEIVELVQFARDRGLTIRFIEFMPLDADQSWDPQQVLDGRQIRRLIEDRWGPLRPAPRDNPAQPAVDFEFPDGRGRVGVISPVSAPFCDACDRLRITAEGQLRNCLFASREWDARALLRGGLPAEELDERLRGLVRECVAEKAAAHGIGQPDFAPPTRAMYQIGG